MNSIATHSSTTSSGFIITFDPSVQLFKAQDRPGQVLIYLITP